MDEASPCNRGTASTKRPKASNASLNVGGHVSLGSKPANVISAMHGDGFDSLQIHAASPRQWRIPSTKEDREASIRAACTEKGMSLYLHAIYLLNFASADEQIYESSIRSLSWTLHTASRLDAQAVVFHMGSHRGLGFPHVLTRVVSGLERVLQDAPDGPLLLLENSAGAGDCIGSHFDELGEIITSLGKPEGVGVCLDTAHAFAVGYDIRTELAVTEMLTGIDRDLGLERLKLIHVNDSKTELASQRDRHENIGEGRIGLEGFHTFLSFPEIRCRPLVLETPNPERRVGELRLLRNTSEGLGRAAA